MGRKIYFFTPETQLSSKRPLPAKQVSSLLHLGNQYGELEDHPVGFHGGSQYWWIPGCQ